MKLKTWKQVTSLWRRVFALSWPVAIQQTLETLMRTVDIIVTGLFSPASVAAIGLADLYAQIPLRLGLGLGSGAIALSSQDTGRGSVLTRDQTVSQAMMIGFLAGLPVVAIGITLGHLLISILGAELEVVRLGGSYLMVVFSAAPMRIVAIVGARSLQGTGDTRTPMVVGGIANGVNILLTVGFGLGIGPLPSLGIVGVGLGTAAGRTVAALAFSSVIASGWTDLSFTRPTNITVTKQLIAVSVPNFAEGMSNTIANYPFNALLLLFGTEVTAAYHIGRRVSQQVTGPLYRSFNVAASIIVGQTLGEGDVEGARFAGLAISGLAVLTLGIAGLLLIVAARPIAALFTADISTLAHAVTFTQVFGISMVFFGIFFSISGNLRGAGDTRTPFYARFTGTFVFMLGLSYLVGVYLDLGLIGLYAGIILSYGWAALVVTVGFFWGSWAETASAMIAERRTT